MLKKNKRIVAEKYRGRRILMLLENCGYPRDDRVRREARSLVAAGYEVTVLCPGSREEPRQEILDGVHIVRFPAPPRATGFIGYLWEYAYSLSAMFILSLFVVARRGFDAVHAHQPPDAFVFIAAFYKLWGKRYIVDHHDIAPELYHARFGGHGNRAVFRILVGLERLSCLLADQVIATNESYKRIEMRRGRVPEERITVVRNGPDVNEIRPVDPDSAIRNRAAVIIGYVGAIGRQDGVDYLLRALRSLVGELGKTGFLCLIVGAGHALAGLKSMSRRLGIADYVIFTGWIDRAADVSRFLSTMDICVAPEPSDPYNDRSTAAKVMEYMACGKPIVAFDLPEHRVTAADAAVYARPNDAADFAGRLALLMDDPSIREGLGRRGRARIDRELGWEFQAKALLDMYRRVFPWPEARPGEAWA
jgi:glycosyltransferase involved in cell wall biosynthesis